MVDKDLLSIQEVRALVRAARKAQPEFAQMSQERVDAVIKAVSEATAAQAEEVCAMIRSTVGELYDEAVAEGLTIQYGGSMKPGNAAELLSQPDIDGGLIGGAALKAEDFAAIIAACRG